MLKTILLLLALSTLIHTSTINNQISLAVTIYNNQFAMVKDVRSITFDQGKSDLYFTDVSSNIETETVTFKALDQPEHIRVFEQNYEANLINPDSILKRYINKNIEVYARLGEKSYKYNGTLLGYTSGYVLKTASGIQVLNNIQGIHFPELPKGFYTVPTLNWKVLSTNPITTNCEVAYRTTGFSWKSDYSVLLSNDQKKADVGGWVTIDNNSGKRYENASLKLIAGDVNTVNKNLQNRQNFAVPRTAVLKTSSAPSFSQKSFSDFHMYTLSEPVSLNQNSQKQVQFINKVYNIDVRKYNLLSISANGYDQPNLKASNNIQFANTKANKLGIPLPKGTVRVFKADDSDGSLQFIGESSIDHTPKDQNITLVTGNAFDITANKYATNTQRYQKGAYSSDLNLTISNHKDIAAQIVINFSNGYGDNLKLTWKSQDVKVEVVSSSLVKITKVFAANQKYSLLWNQNYRP